MSPEQLSCWIGNRTARDQIDFTAGGADMPLAILDVFPDAVGIRVAPKVLGFVVCTPRNKETPNAFGLRIGRTTAAAVVPESDWRDRGLLLSGLAGSLLDPLDAIARSRGGKASGANRGTGPQKRLPWQFMLTGLPLFDTRLADIAEELRLPLGSDAVLQEHRRRTAA
jgi:hypothetical protein